MKEWLIRILTFFMLVVLVFNFVRFLFVPNSQQFEFLDIRAIAGAISRFDVPVQGLFADLYASFTVLKQGFDSMFISIYSISHSTSILYTIGSLFKLLIIPIELVVVLAKTLYDFIVFLIAFLRAFYDLLTLLFGSYLFGT